MYKTSEKAAHYYEFLGMQNNFPLNLCVMRCKDTLFHKQNRLEIAYVLRGEFRLYTEKFNATIQKHDIAVIAPEDIHRFESAHEEDGDLLIFHIDTELLPISFFENGSFECESIVYSNSKGEVVYNKLMEQLSKLVSTLIHEKQTLTSEIMLIAATLMVTIKSDSKIHSKKMPSKNSNSEKYIEIVKYIEQHLYEDITLSDIAEKLHYSESYASKFFKRNLGISFSKHLARARIRASLEDLAQGKLTIAEIAIKYGMANTKAYAAYFKEFYEITPNMYRKRFEKNYHQSDYDATHKYQMPRKEILALLSHMINREFQVTVDIKTESIGACAPSIQTLYISDIDYCMNSFNYPLFDDIVKTLDLKHIILDNATRLLEILNDNSRFYSLVEFLTYVNELGIKMIFVDRNNVLSDVRKHNLSQLEEMQIQVIEKYQHDAIKEDSIESILKYTQTNKYLPCSMFENDGFYHMIDKYNYKSDFFFILALISKVKGDIIYSESGCIISRSNNSIQILLYNDYNMDKYHDATYNLTLKSLNGRYFMTEYYVSQLLQEQNPIEDDDPMSAIFNKRRLYARHSGRFGHATESIFTDGQINISRVLEKGTMIVIKLKQR